MRHSTIEILSLAMLPIALVTASASEVPDVRAVDADVFVVGSGPIQGRIADPAGAPLVKLTVKLVNAEGKMSASTVTDDAGRFILPAAKDGSYLITLGNGLVQGRLRVDARASAQAVDIDVLRSVAEGWSPVFLAPVGSADADNHVTGPGVLQGVLTVAATSAPIPDAVVRLLNAADGKQLARVVTDGQGSFNVGEIAPGRYTLAIGRATVLAGVVVEADRPAPALLRLATDPELLEAGRSGRLVWSRRRLVPAESAGGGGGGTGGTGSVAKPSVSGTGHATGVSGGSAGDIRLPGGSFGFFPFRNGSSVQTSEAGGAGSTGASSGVSSTRSGVAGTTAGRGTSGGNGSGGSTGGVAVPLPVGSGGTGTPQAQSGFFNRGRRVASSTN